VTGDISHQSITEAAMKAPSRERRGASKLTMTTPHATDQIYEIVKESS